MTVKELQELLQHFPPEARVWVEVDEFSDEIGRGEMKNLSWLDKPVLMLESL